MSRTEPSVYWVFTVWFFFTDLSNLSGRWCGWALVGSSLSTGAVCGLGSIIEGGRGWALDAGHLIEDDQIEIDETSIQVSNRSMKSEFQNSIGNRSVAEAHPTAYSPGEMRCNTSTPLSLSLFIYLSIYMYLYLCSDIKHVCIYVHFEHYLSVSECNWNNPSFMFRAAKYLTYNFIGAKKAVDTSLFRRCIWNYIQVRV